MRIVLLVIVANKFIELIVASLFPFHHPEQKRAYRVITHQRVKKSLDLSGVPDHFALNCR